MSGDILGSECACCSHCTPHLRPQKSVLCRQRCRTTIEDFVCTYFPLYGLDPSKVRTHIAQGNGRTRTCVSSCP